MVTRKRKRQDNPDGLAIVRNMSVRLERERANRGLGKVEFCRFLGVSESVYFEILDGTGNPTIMTVTRMAQSLNMPTWALLFVPDADNENS